MFSQRGFTDHEHLDSAELIHMNGRVYDYNLGRFMSVDPLIQGVGNSQGINPYAYVMNNPLSFTDPSGYSASCTGSRIKGTSCASTGASVQGNAGDYDKKGEQVMANVDSAIAQLQSTMSFNQTSSSNTSVMERMGQGEIAKQEGSGGKGGGTNVAASTTAGTAPQGGTATIPNIGDLADGIGKELLGAVKKGLILYALKPGELGDATISGAIARGEMDESQLILYHYTNSEENLASIVQTQTFASIFR